MDCVGKVLETLLAPIWTLLNDQWKNLLNVEENVKDLREKIECLQRRMEDVKTCIANAEQNGWIRKREVDGWVQSATKIQEEAEDIANKYKNRPKCLDDCSGNLLVSYNVSREATKKLAKVNALIKEGESYKTGEPHGVAFQRAEKKTSTPQAKAAKDSSLPTTEDATASTIQGSPAAKEDTTTLAPMQGPQSTISLPVIKQPFDNSLEKKIVDEAMKKDEEASRIHEERHRKEIETELKMVDSNRDPKLQRPYLERQHEQVDALIDFLYKNSKNLGFSAGKPVAAFTIYRCLLHWKSFEAERNSVFKRLSQLIDSEIENEEDNDNLAYWLSNTSSLLFLLQKSLKAAGSPGSVSRKKPPQPTSLLGRMAQGLLSASFVNMTVEATDVVHQVEAKNPAFRFQQRLTAYVEKIYGIIRDNIKKELSSLISLCIQAPRTMKAASMLPGRFSGSQSHSHHWQKIIESLENLLDILQDNHVPPVLAQKIFTQIFSYINVQLFNSLLLRRECCSFSNGEYVKSGLAELELWCAKAEAEYAGSSWDELKHIRQAVGFLVIVQKVRIPYDELANDLCPILTVQQLYRICTLFWDDKYNTQSVSSVVVSCMRVLMTEDSNSAESSSFLLDDNSIIPFSVDDISNSIQEEDFTDVKPAEELLENPAFQFLQE